MSRPDDGARPDWSDGDSGVETHGQTIAKWVKRGQRVRLATGWGLVTRDAVVVDDIAVIEVSGGIVLYEAPHKWLDVRSPEHVYKSEEWF